MATRKRTAGQLKDDQTIIAYRNEGYSIETIALLMGYSDTHIQNQIKYLVKNGLAPNIKKGRRKRGSELPVMPPTVSVYGQPSFGHRCRYPSCSLKAEYSFALVDLCPFHFETIKDETSGYYGALSKFTYESRRHYLAISYMIPWRSKTGGKR